VDVTITDLAKELEARRTARTSAGPLNARLSRRSSRVHRSSRRSRRSSPSDTGCPGSTRRCRRLETARRGRQRRHRADASAWTRCWPSSRVLPAGGPPRRRTWRNCVGGRDSPDATGPHGARRRARRVAFAAGQRRPRL